MKSTAAMAAAAVLVFRGKETDAFFMPAGSLIGGGAPSTAPYGRSSTGVSRASNALTSWSTGCSCPSCSSSSSCGRSCGCPSCSSALSGRSHVAGCRCGSCSVRMQAHPVGCACADCSTTASSALHGSSCTCSCCAPGAPARAPGAVCLCGGCRKNASVTVMGMGAGEGEGESKVGAALRERVAAEPASVMFDDTMAAIADGFTYTPKRR